MNLSVAGLRAPRRAIALVAALALVVAGFGSWRYVTSSVANDIEVAWVGAPVCRGTTVVADDGSGHQNVIQARAGMHCTITVRVTNHSGHEVGLGRAVADTLGRSGAVVKVEPGSDWAAFPGKGIRSLDAYLHLDTHLAPDESTQFVVPIAFRDSGCNLGTTVWSRAWPEVEVRTFRRTLTVGGHDEFVFYGAGRASGCLD